MNNRKTKKKICDCTKDKECNCSCQSHLFGHIIQLTKVLNLSSKLKADLDLEHVFQLSSNSSGLDVFIIENVENKHHKDPTKSSNVTSLYILESTQNLKGNMQEENSQPPNDSQDDKNKNQIINNDPICPVNPQTEFERTTKQDAKESVTIHCIEQKH